MLFSHSWVSQVGFPFNRSARSHRVAQRKRQKLHQRLALEQLEERDMPSRVLPGLYIGDNGDNTVKRFDEKTGAFLGTFVTSPAGGLNGSRGLLFDEKGNLLVVNQNVGLPINGEIDRFSGKTGASLGAVVPSSDPNGPYAPRGAILGPDDTLYVADLTAPDNVSDGKIEEYQYNEKTGTAVFKGEIDHPAGFTGQFHPRSLVIGPDGMLYVSNRNIPQATGGEVLRFNPSNGEFRGVFVESDGTNDLQRPEGLTFGPDGNLYITSFRTDATDTDKILEFKGNTGAYLGKIDLDSVGGDRAFAQALLFGPGGCLFVPITGSGADTGEVRQYNVATKTFNVFVPPNALGGSLGSPWYLTFAETDPATLSYSEDDSNASSSSTNVLTTTSNNVQIVSILTSTPTAPQGVTSIGSSSIQAPRKNEPVTLTTPQPITVPSMPSSGSQASAHEVVFIKLGNAILQDPLADDGTALSVI